MLWWAVQNVLVTAVLVGIVWTAARLLRIGPVARHALWLIVLIKFVTPPLVVWPWAVSGPFPDANSPVIAAGGSPRADARAPARGNDESAPSDDDTAIGSLEVPTAVPPGVQVTPHVDRNHAPALKISEWLLPVLGALWFAGGLSVALLQLVRVLRMGSHVRFARAAPPSLLQRVAELSALLGMRPVRTRLVPGIGSPLIWSLGRPQLLWPAELDPSQLRGHSLRGLVLHELAHVKRRDHWVGWLELVAGCLWWWNPLFWYVRHQLRENAELACDGWVVQALPGGRRAYAEALLAVCEFISGRTHPMPAVGVSTGGRRFLERRLAMILRESTSLRLSRAGLMILGLLTATALPVWSQKSQDAGAGKAVLSRPDSLAESLDRVNTAARDESRSVKEYDSRRPVNPAGTDSLRDDVVGRLQTLRDLYARAGRSADVAAVNQALIALSRPTRSSQVRPDPGTLTEYRGRDGDSYVFAVIGSTDGRIWGSDVYTDDSPLAVAAVHAGVAAPGLRALVKVTILPGRQSYEGSERNGVQSASYGPWAGSYRVEPVRAAYTALGNLTSRDRVVLPDPGTLMSYRDRVGKSFTFNVTGSKEGTVWGSGTYTDDSPLAVAAVHTGVLQPGERGRVRVTILPGRESYEGSTQNGVTSLSYGPFEGAYRIDRVRRLKPEGTVVPSVERLRDQVGRRFHIPLTGSREGSVWGGSDGVYTDDSSLPAAAVHAGVLKPGEHGQIAITVLPGRDHYEGSTRHGVTSGSWGAWQGSFRIERGDQPPQPPTF